MSASLRVYACLGVSTAAAAAAAAEDVDATSEEALWGAGAQCARSASAIARSSGWRSFGEDAEEEEEGEDEAEDKLVSNAQFSPGSSTCSACSKMAHSCDAGIASLSAEAIASASWNTALYN